MVGVAAACITRHACLLLHVHTHIHVTAWLLYTTLLLTHLHMCTQPHQVRLQVKPAVCLCVRALLCIYNLFLLVVLLMMV